MIFLEIFGILSQLRGGGSANPKFLSNFSKTKFTLELPINVMKHIIHRWGVDISSIHVVIGPPIRHPNQKNEIFHEKNNMLT